MAVNTCMLLVLTNIHFFQTFESVGIVLARRMADASLGLKLTRFISNILVCFFLRKNKLFHASGNELLEGRA